MKHVEQVRPEKTVKLRLLKKIRFCLMRKKSATFLTIFLQILYQICISDITELTGSGNIDIHPADNSI